MQINNKVWRSEIFCPNRHAGRPAFIKKIRIAISYAIQLGVSISLCVVPFHVSSQVATTYTFSQSAGTYSPISGGTVFGSSAIGNMDDEVSRPIIIPGFTFDGIVYTYIYINTNGYITFGKSSSPLNFHGISGTESYSGAVAAFSENLNVATSGSGDIRYQQVGNEFVIQWQNVARSGVTAEHISFQIRLNISDNRITIVYGGTIIPGVNASYPEIGLRGPNNTFATNVNNRKVISTTGGWLNSTAGTSNTSTCYFNTATPATSPAVGTTFTWTPPALDLQTFALALPATSGCYGNNETVSVMIRNIGSGMVNFSSSPATVSGNVTGPNAVSFTPVAINSGTLAPNAIQNITLSSAYNMSLTGNYTFNASVSVAGDAYITNNAMQPVIRESHTPAVTASPDVSICAGQSIGLNSTSTAYAFTGSQSNTTPLLIPDNSSAGANSTILVTGTTAAASQASIRIDNLAHTFDEDIILKLTAPDGSSILLSNEEGGDGAGFLNTFFSSSAITPISSGTAPFTGTFLPEDPFSLLTGPLNGTWTLNVSDHEASDIGTLLGWTLIFPVPNSIASYQWNPSAGLSSASISNPVATPASTTAYVVTVTDSSGCARADTLTVTVNPLPEINSPTVTQPNCLNVTGTIEVNASGNGILEYNLNGGTFQTISSFSSLIPGNYNIAVRLQSNPDCGTNYSGNPVVINLPDSENPQITCPGNIHVSNDAGMCGAIINIVPATATDNCSGTLTISGTRNDNQPLTDPYPTGTTLITWTATDSFGNRDSCQQTVQIDDTENPQITCPVNIHVSNDAGMCGAVINIGQATALDNCFGTILISGIRNDNQPLTDPYPVGTTSVTWKATDISGNSDSCQQLILVDDNENPIIVCQPDIIVPENPAGSGSATVTPDLPIASDNCPNVNITGTRSDAQALNASYPVGITTILWTATDASGNADACHQSIIVQPTCRVYCPADTSVASSSSQCGAFVNYPSALITGNCGILNYSITSGSFFPAGINTVIVTSTAGPSCTFTVTVNDTIKPTISCPSNVVIPNDPNHCNAVFNFSPVATDNCTGVSVTCIPPSGSTFPVGTTTVSCTAKDAANNSAVCSFTVTVQDMENPVIHCPATVFAPADVSQLYASNVVTGTATATDNCGIQQVAGVRSDALGLSANYPIGTTVITWTATDVNGRNASCTQTITIGKRASTIVYTGDTAVQYSDNLVVRALLKDQLSNNPVAGRTITFNTGFQSVSAVTNASGIATANLAVYKNPGSYTVSTVFQGDNIYFGSSDSDPFKINKENAEVVYTGPEFVTVSCANCNTTSILLSASIKDITGAVIPGDPNPGDIRKARVRFVNADDDVPISTWLMVGLVSSSDSIRGAVSYAWTVSIPSGGYIDPYTVRVEVDSGNYIGSTEAVINVSRGTLSDFISGGGHIISTLSAGQYASDPLKKTHFGFNIKHNQSCQNLQGKINVVFRRTQSGVVHVYQLKGSIFNSLSVNITAAAKNASFTCKATLKDVTNPRTPVSIGSNLTLQVTVTDRGSPGTNDSIGFTLWNSSNALLYSSNWINTGTVEKNLASGNIIIHRGNNGNRETEEPAVQGNEFNVTVMPNPSINYFTLVVESSSSDYIRIRVMDLTGKIIEVKNSLVPDEAVEIGNEYKAGMYFIQVWQGDIRKTLKILKQ